MPSFDVIPTIRCSASTASDHPTLVRGWRRERAGFFLRAETMFNVATEAEQQALDLHGWRNLHAPA